MSFKPNSRALFAAFGALATACTTTTPLLPGLSSFKVVANDESNAIDTLPSGATEVHLDITAIDKTGATDTTYSGFVEVFSVPGFILSNLGPDGRFSPSAAPAASPAIPYPTVQLTNGHVAVDAWAVKVFGETVFWVEDVSGTDAGAGNDLGASGVSNPIRYANLILQDTQITETNIYGPFDGSQATFDETTTRCLAPPGDGGACPPGQTYQMDLIVSAVGSDFFTVLDRNAYDHDSGVPNPGVDPNTGLYDLPGSWASMYVYTYDAPPLVLGDRLSFLTGTLQEFAGDTQLNFPSFKISADSQLSVPQPQDIPPPVPINPAWCTPQDASDQPSDDYLCETSITDEHFESLESALVSLSNATMPTRWISCNLDGTGTVSYRPAAGCMPQTSGNFCDTGNGTGYTCLAGEDCVANECVAQCQTDSDCATKDPESCVDGHCQNNCLCRQYCDSIPTCAELSDYNTYGQYTVSFPGLDGGVWKFGAITKTGVPSFNPYSNPGIVVDFLNGVLEEVDASDPPWLIVPRIPTDMCCHADSPGCGEDAGLAVCPRPSSP